MKAFICALSVFLLLSCAVTINAIYVQKETEQLADIVESLSEEIEYGDITQIREKWEHLEPIISYSVSHKETDQIADALAALESYQSTGEEKEYHAARQQLLDLVRRLSQSEGFSIKNIF